MSIATNDRAAWVQQGRWTSSPSMLRDKLRWIVIHYPGANGQPKNRAEVIERLRSGHERDRVRLPGNYKYGFAIDPFGESWEGRGLDCRNAANGSKTPYNWNDATISVQFMVDVTMPISSKQLDEGRRLVKEIREWAGRELEVVGHWEGRGRLGFNSTQTSCPGDYLKGLIATRSFETMAPPVPPTPPVVPPVGVGRCQVQVTSADAQGGMWSVARSIYGVANNANVARLLEANPGLDPQRMRAGDWITVPGLHG